MHKTKGTAILARLQFLEEKGRGDILDSLSDEHRAALAAVFPIGLYDVALKRALDEAIGRALSPDDPDATYRELGRWSAKKNLAEHQQSFMTPGEPHGILAQFPALHRLYYAEGEPTHTKVAEGHAVLRLKNFHSESWADCLGTAGWWEYALSTAGAKDVRVEHTQCCERGGAFCEWDCTFRR